VHRRPQAFSATSLRVLLETVMITLLLYHRLSPFGTEFAQTENNGPQENNGWKMQDLIMTDEL